MGTDRTLGSEGEAELSFTLGHSFTLGRAIVEGWRLASGCAGPLAVIALIVALPGHASLLLPSGAPARHRAWLALPLLALLVVSQFAAAAAQASAALRAAEGAPVRVGRAIADGLRHAWLIAKVFVLSAWLPSLVALVAGYAIRRRSGSEWAVPVAVALGYSAAMARLYPAMALALVRPQAGARRAVRAALASTRGARLRLFAMALGFQAPALPLTPLLRWARTLPDGHQRLAALAAYALLATLASSLANVAPVVAYVALGLERSRQAIGVEGLAQVFE